VSPFLFWACELALTYPKSSEIQAELDRQKVKLEEEQAKNEVMKEQLK
jgi:hypothetical protein